jgi:hypothetical protein
VPEGVVDRLEGVEVDVDDPEAAGLAPCRRDPDAVGEQDPVGQARERIMEGLVGELRLLLLARGDVLDLGDQVNDAPLLVADGGHVDRCPDVVPARVQAALLGAEAIAVALDDLAHRLDAVGDVVGVGDLRESPAEQLGRLVAQQLAERGVDAGELPVGRDQGHADPVVLERAAEALLGLLQGELGVDPLADVVHEGVEGPAGLGADRRDRHLDRELAGVAAHRLGLDPVAGRSLAPLGPALEARDRQIPLGGVHDRVHDRFSEHLRPLPAEHALGRKVPLHDPPLIVNRDEGVLGGLQDRPRLAGQRSGGTDQLLHRDSGGAADHGRQTGPHDLVVVVRRADQQGRQRHRRHHRSDRRPQLAAGSVQGQPGDRNDDERLEDDRVLRAGVPQQADHHEAGEHGQDLGPVGQPLPGQQQRAAQDRGRDREGGRDLPGVHWNVQQRQQGERQNPREQERGHAPQDVVPLEEVAGRHLGADPTQGPRRRSAVGWAGRALGRAHRCRSICVVPLLRHRK